MQHFSKYLTFLPISNIYPHIQYISKYSTLIWKIQISPKEHLSKTLTLMWNVWIKVKDLSEDSTFVQIFNIYPNI